MGECYFHRFKKLKKKPLPAGQITVFLRCDSIRPLSAPRLVAGNDAYDETNKNEADTDNQFFHMKSSNILMFYIKNV